MSDALNEAKLELIKGNANMYITFNMIKDDETGFLYCALEDIVEMSDPNFEGSIISQYRKFGEDVSEKMFSQDKDISSPEIKEAKRRSLYDRCSMVPLLAYTMIDHIEEAFDKLESVKEQLFAETGLNIYFPEEVNNELNGMLGISRDAFWTRIRLLAEEFPPRAELPVKNAMRAGEEYSIKIFKRLAQERDSHKIIPNEMLITEIKNMLK